MWFLALLKAIPDLVKGIGDFVSLVKQTWAAYQQAHKEGWINEGREITNAITNAKTDDERRELVKRLASHTRDTP